MIGEELPWPQVEAAAADKIARHTREGKVREGGEGEGRGPPHIINLSFEAETLIPSPPSLPPSLPSLQPSLLLAGPAKLPSRKQRFSVIHEGIPRRPLPPSYAKTRSEKMHFCDRVITDDAWGEAQCRQVVDAIEVREGGEGGWECERLYCSVHLWCLP